MCWGGGRGLVVGERLGDSIVKWEWDEVCGGIWVGWVMGGPVLFFHINAMWV